MRRLANDGRATARPVRLAVVLSLALLSACALPGGGGVATPPKPRVMKIVFPLAADSVRFTSGFGDGRDGSRLHKGQDMFCARWTPVLAATSGTVDWVSTKRPPKEKGYYLLLRGDDGNLYFYAHLNDDNPGTRDNAGEPRYAYARGLKNGDRVAAGDVIAYVGDSGNAVKWGPHLHFEIHIEKWGNAIDPAPSLKAALAARR